jgi:hypothetical protein
MLVKILIMVLWIVTQCGLVVVSSVLEDCVASIFRLFTLNMWAMLVTTCKAVWHHNPETTIDNLELVMSLVIARIHQRRNINVNSGKEINSAIDKVCAEFFNGVMGKVKKNVMKEQCNIYV